MSNETAGFRRALGTIGRGAIAAGLGSVIAVVHEGTAELNENTISAAQSAAAIKSTGGVANVAAKDIDRMAQALHKKTGVDDNAIARGENMLLTFTNIRNEVGKGPKTFDQATRTLVDMSTALGTDASKSAIQLGKALNDPVRGVTALTKVGVTFDAAQRKTIKRLVETGQSAKAQQIILSELNREFGGSAEAYGRTMPARIARTREAFAGVSAEIVQFLMPAFEDGVTRIDEMIDTLEQWANSDSGKQQLREIADGARDLGSAVATAGGVLLDTTGFLIRHRDALTATAVTVGSMWTAYRGYVVLNSVRTALQATNAVQLLLTASTSRSVAIARTQQTQLAGTAAASTASSAAMLLAGNSTQVLGANMTRTAAASSAARGAITVAGTTAAASGGRMALAARGVGGFFTALTGLSGPVGLAIGAVGLLGLGAYKAYEGSKKEAEGARQAAAAWRTYVVSIDSASAARDQINRKKLDVADAAVALERAEINLKRVQQDANASALDRREALNNVKRAQMANTDAVKAASAEQAKANASRVAGINVAKNAAAVLNNLNLAQAEEKRLLADRNANANSSTVGLYNAQLSANRKKIDGFKGQEDQARKDLETIRKKGYADYVTIGNQTIVKMRRGNEVMAGVAKTGARNARGAVNAQIGKVPGEVGAHVNTANRRIAQIGNVKLNREQIIARLTIPFRNLGATISGAIGKVKVGIDAVLSLGGLVGDSFDAGGLPPGVSPHLGKFAAIGQRLGLSIPSGGGKRPSGTRTASGGISDHSSGHAIDLAGPKPAMAKMAELARKMPGSKQVIYSPKGLSNSGSGWGAIGNAAVERMHYSHVHVAAFQRGGVIGAAMGAGIVPGMGDGDRIPALLEPGEVVVNRNAVAAFGGPDAFHAATNLAVPRFQIGGPVARKKKWAEGSTHGPYGSLKFTKGRLDLTAIDGRQKMPVEKNVRAWLKKYQGRGISLAQVNAIAEWEKNNYSTYKKNAYQRGGVVGRYRRGVKIPITAKAPTSVAAARLPSLAADRAALAAAAKQRALVAADSAMQLAAAKSEQLQQTKAEQLNAQRMAAQKKLIADGVRERNLLGDPGTKAGQAKRAKLAKTTAGKNKLDAADKLVENRRAALVTMVETEKGLNEKQVELADSVVDLTKAVKDEDDTRRVDLADSQTALRGAENSVAAALAKRTPAIDDDVASLQTDAALAVERRQVIERELAAGGLSTDAVQSLTAKRAEAINAEEAANAAIDDLRQAARDQAQQLRVDAADTATAMRSAELDVEKALAEGTATLEDDVAEARKRLGVAAERRRIVEAELAAGDLDPASRIALLAKRAETIRAERAVGDELAELAKTIAGPIDGAITGVETGTAATVDLAADMRALLGAIRDGLISERGNVGQPIAITNHFAQAPAVDTWLATQRYTLTEAGAGGSI